MSVSELGSALVTHFPQRRRAPDRRMSREPAPLGDLASAAPSSPPAPAPLAQDPAFLAPVFRPDLSQLATLAEARPPCEAPASPCADPKVHAYLHKLVAAIREGDLDQARAVVEALETEIPVESGAGRHSRWRGVDANGAPAGRAALLCPVDAVYETLAQFLVTDGPTS